MLEAARRGDERAFAEVVGACAPLAVDGVRVDAVVALAVETVDVAAGVRAAT